VQKKLLICAKQVKNIGPNLHRIPNNLLIGNGLVSNNLLRLLLDDHILLLLNGFWLRLQHLCLFECKLQISLCQTLKGSHFSYLLRVGLLGVGRGLRHHGRPLLASGHVADEQGLVGISGGLLGGDVALGATLGRRLHHGGFALRGDQLRGHRTRLKGRLASRDHLREYFLIG